MKIEFTFSCFDHFDNELHDLQAPPGPKLEIGINPLEGAWPKALTTRRIQDPEQLRQALVEVDRNRGSHPRSSDFGRASNFTTTFYTLQLRQKINTKDLVSYMRMIELPGAEKLMSAQGEELERLQAREGTTLNKSILSFGRVVRSLAAGEAEYVDFQDSVVCQMLEDSLVGNCKTIFLVLLCYWDYQACRISMDYAKMVEKLRTFPIENTTMARGLLAKSRSDLARLAQDIKGFEACEKNQETRSLMLKINELEGKTIDESLQRLKAHQEKEQLYEKVVQYRDKYNQLVESKAAVQQKLIESEEERLTVSKALIDLEIEKNQGQERAEAGKYEVMNKLLNAENEVVQLQMRDEEQSKAVTMLQAENDKVVAEKKQLVLELVAVKESFTKLKGEQEQLQKKNDDINVNMVNLINAKKELERQDTENNKLLSEQATEIAQLKEQCEKMQEELLQKEREVNELRHNIQDLSQEVNSSNWERARQETDMVTEKNELEKNAIAYTRDRDAELLILKEEQQGLLKKMEEERLGLQEDLQKMDLELRNEQARRQEAEDTLQEKEELDKSNRQELDDLTRQKLEQGDEYRSQIMLNMERVADLAKAFEGQGGSAGKQGQLRAEIDHMVQQLIESYTHKEQELVQDKERYKSKVEELIARNHRLHSAHLRCREQLLALAPRGQTPNLEDVSELRSGGQGDLDEELVVENKSIKRRLATLENEKIQMHAEQMRLNTTWQETITELTSKGEKNVAELEVLRKENAQLLSAKQALELGLQQGGEATKHIMELQEQTVEDIHQMKERGIQFRPKTGDLSIDDITAQRKMQELLDEKSELREMVHRLNAEKETALADHEELRHVRQEKEMLAKQLDVITGSDNTRQQLSAMVVQLKERVHELERGGGRSDLQKEMREWTLNTQKELEAERAQLKMRCSMAEGKLEHMKEYMGTTMTQYQSQILELKRQLQKYQR